MDINYIIDLMVALSPSSELQNLDLEKETYVRYINLVWSQIHAKIATNNIRSQIREEIVNTQWTGVIELTRKPLTINRVFIPTLKNHPYKGYIFQRSIFEIEAYDPELSAVNYPEIFFLQNDVIRLYPEPPQAFIFTAIVSYTPDFEPLTLTSTLPIPNAYYPVVAKGALNYLLIDMGGFKDTITKQKAEKEFQEGMNDLCTFIANESAKYINLSTYSNM